MTLTFQDALNAIEGKEDCQTACKILRHMAMKDEQKAPPKKEKRPNAIKVHYDFFYTTNSFERYIDPSCLTIHDAKKVRKWLDRFIVWYDDL